MTLTELKGELETNPSMIKKIMYRNSTISGTKSYWFARGRELLSMVEQLGLPTLFFTLSAADLHWPDLFKIIAPNEDLDTMTEFRRRKLVKANPMIVDNYFLKRAETFINNVLVKKFKVTDLWYRVEYQHRGSPHIHGVLWLENALDVTNILEKSEEEQEKIIDYFKNFVTAFHPNQEQPPGNIHPCRKLLSEVVDFHEDLAEILNKVQRHTLCSEQYCIRKCKQTNMKKCRFRFPQDEEPEAKIGINEKGNVEFIPKRNDPRLNKYNAYITQTWRANTDVPPVISKQALINYLAKYISKSEYRQARIQGGGNGGTGKSLVIANIAYLIFANFGVRSCLLLGPTGVSALNINGSTLHSALKLDLNEDYKNLNGDQLFKFQDAMKDVKFLIIDEFGMVGCQMLWHIDQRLRQGKDNPTEPYGGVYVFKFGDINQLPPVLDSAPYTHNQHTMEKIGGKALYDNVEKVFILNNIHRQKDQVFQKILNNIASGQVGDESSNRHAGRTAH
ncbi:ATP-dependent DNA helicase RRM3, partial [Frankliniella fusca]